MHTDFVKKMHAYTCQNPALGTRKRVLTYSDEGCSERDIMRRILLRVAYDGTRYSGWQIQPNGNTIESELSNALYELTGEASRIIGAGRTDAGVHSLGNVAVFDTNSAIPGEKFLYCLNAILPEDIRITESKETDAHFHPRKQNSIKTYEYKIFNRCVQMPLNRFDTYHFYGELDADAMQEAGSLLVGEHDFGAFCSAGSQAEDTIRRITALQVSRDGDVVRIRVSGNGFLYNMVRIIAGTLIEVGRGKMSSDDVRDMLIGRKRSDAGRKVPAKGLTMIGITYTDEQYPQFIDSDTWNYEIYKSENTLYINMKYCRSEEEFQILLGKLIHHGYRDGAEAVYVRGFGCGDEEIQPHVQVGHFLMEEKSVSYAGKLYYYARDCYQCTEKNRI